MNDEALAQIIYVAGYGRSGSTVLDMILSSHPEVFGAGEVNMFLPDLVADGSCSCGQRYDQCDVWKPVVAELKENFPRLVDPTFVADIYQSEATSGLVRHRPRRHKSDDEAGELWKEFYRIVAETTGCAMIVDSSKTARFSSRRIRRLTKNAGLDVNVLHLTRDPRAVVYSEQRRGNNDQLESGNGGRGLGGLVRPVAGWAMANLAVDAHRALHPSLRVQPVRYEDLVAEPVHSIADICRFLNIDPAPILARIESGAGFEPGHGIRGNRLRRPESTGSNMVHLRSDTAWRNSLDRRLRVTAALSYPLARRYGYDVLGS